MTLVMHLCINLYQCLLYMYNYNVTISICNISMSASSNYFIMLTEPVTTSAHHPVWSCYSGDVDPHSGSQCVAGLCTWCLRFPYSVPSRHYCKTVWPVGGVLCLKQSSNILLNRGFQFGNTLMVLVVYIVSVQKDVQNKTDELCSVQTTLCFQNSPVAAKSVFHSKLASSWSCSAPPRHVGWIITLKVTFNFIIAHMVQMLL